MHVQFIAPLSAAALFLGILGFAEMGRRCALAHSRSEPGGAGKGTGAVEAAVFGLLGLIIAFTFSGAGSRFEGRRALILREANAISTAYLRLDLLPAASQPELRNLFRRYAEVRLATYTNAADAAFTSARISEASALHAEIWSRALQATRAQDCPATAPNLLLPAINEMSDMVAMRIAATRNHPPLIIFALLFGLSLIGSLLVGYSLSGSRSRNWLHTIVYGLILSFTVYVIIDLEFPRLGWIRVDASDKALAELRRSMD